MQMQTTAQQPTPTVYIAPVVAQPSFTPLPPTSAITEPVDWVLTANGIQHIDDPAGLGRRLFEGWASLGGVDYQDMEITPDAFTKMASDYLAKNPVLLWDHIRHLPIGTVHALHVTDEGLYIQGEIWRLEDIDWDDETETKKANAKGETYVGTESIGKKCNEVWALIRSGKIRGLSIRGKARQYMAVYSPELKKYIPRITEVLLYEISVTPTQVHPGSKITAVNTLAKSLELMKGLPLIPSLEHARGSETHITPSRARFSLCALRQNKRGETAMSFEAIRQLQVDLEKALGELESEGDTIEIPVDVAEGFKRLGNAVELEPTTTPSSSQNNAALPADFKGVLEKALEEKISPLMQRLESLEENRPSSTPQPQQSRIRASAVKPEGARPKPTGAQGQSGLGAVQKAMEILATSINGKANYGTGDFHGCGIIEASQLAMLEGTLQGHFWDGHTVHLGEPAQKLLQSCMAN